ncbi:MAG TPA: AraC family transcriptional regulator ligand-binding domain-containing protein [Polyangia bacterium]|nr:AraC family transcriptional regulator ligand-binding domain-containing protein [Polyangia bacterium]
MPVDETDAHAEPGTSPVAVAGMLVAMRGLGLDVPALCAAGGFSESALATRTVPLALHELVPVWRLATRQFGRNTLGLHVGAAVPQGTLLEYVAAASPTLRAALGQIARYIGLATRNVRWEVGSREPDGLTTFEERAASGQATIPPQLTEFGLALVTSRVRLWFDQRPREIWFTHGAQGAAAEYQDVLGCPVRFERERNALRFDDDALEAPAQRHDPNLFRLLEAHAEKVLAEMPATATLRERVRREVVRHLREGEPSIAAIAATLTTSERSLQRKLQTEGVSFRDVVDEARHKLAVVYLSDPTLTLTDVACLLGYSEGAAFTRAFKRWTGSAPSQARR